MKAVLFKGIGDASQLSVEPIDKPEINADEILVKTKAFSINPIEIKTRNGNRFSEKLLADKPSILGWDGAGIIEKTGTAVNEFKKRDRVYGIIGFPKFGKTYAEYFVAKEKDLVLIPENSNFKEAAVSTIAGLTAYQALKDYAEIRRGTRLLIHAASGGVGHFGIQVAKMMGAEVWATASKEKHDFVKNLGADHLIDYNNEQFEEVAQNMDVVFDLIGGDYIDRSLKTLKKEGGILISIPSATNEKVEEKAQKNGHKGVRYVLDTNKKDMSELRNLIADGKIKPFVSQTFSIDNIQEAHKTLEKGHTKGKIAVTIS